MTMTDVTQGADALDDNALFNDATSSTTLDKFENPELPAEPKPADPPAAATPPKPGEQAAAADPKLADPPDNAPVPPGRLREEAEARRRAERERDALQARLDAMLRQPPPAPQQRQEPKRLDLLDDPPGFVQQEIKPFLEQIRADFQEQREAMSLDRAVFKHGEEKVSAARQALEAGMSRGRGDPAWGVYERAMRSTDPYAVITQWHQEGETLRTVGGDVNAYRTRILDEAMKDPEFQKRVFEAAKGQASRTDNNVARPVRVATSSPSLGNVGAGGGDMQTHEPSDEELFRAATSAKRR